jgi:hypothetical protein
LVLLFFSSENKKIEKNQKIIEKITKNSQILDESSPADSKIVVDF